MRKVLKNIYQRTSNLLFSLIKPFSESDPRGKAITHLQGNQSLSKFYQHQTNSSRENFFRVLLAWGKNQKATKVFFDLYKSLKFWFWATKKKFRSQDLKSRTGKKWNLSSPWITKKNFTRLSSFNIGSPPVNSEISYFSFFFLFQRETFSII